MIDFQPMPKRFMVWQKDYQQFARKVLPGGIRDYVYTLSEMSFYYDDPDCIICQSTNLFDKNGKEIFEGSIVKSFDNVNKISDPYLAPNIEPTYCTTYVEYIKGAYHLSSKKYPNGGCGILDNYCGAMAKDLEVIGHILSNPELLEDK